jgi:integrase
MVNRDNYRLVQRFLDYQRQVLQVDESSAERYRFYLRHILLWADEAPLERAHTLRPTLSDYLVTAANAEDGRAPRAAATQRKILQTAKRLLRWAKLTYPREYRDLPMAWIDALRPPRGAENSSEDHVFVTLDEVQQLIGLPNPDDNLAFARDKAAAALLFVSGMRVGALSTLPLAALDLPSRTVKQWPSLDVHTKNRKSATTYLLEIPELLATVERWDAVVRAALPPEGMWYTPIKVRWGELALSADPPGSGRAVAVGKRIRRLFTAAGLPPKSPHKFRHGHAVWALQHAQTMADYKAISMNLMHEDVRVTDGIYAPLLGSDVRDRITRLAGQGAAQPPSHEAELVPGQSGLSKGQLAAALRHLADELAR